MSRIFKAILNFVFVVTNLVYGIYSLYNAVYGNCLIPVPVTSAWACCRRTFSILRLTFREQDDIQKWKNAEKENKIKQIPSDLSRHDIYQRKKLINDSHFEDCVRDRTLVRKKICCMFLMKSGKTVIRNVKKRPNGFYFTRKTSVFEMWLRQSSNKNLCLILYFLRLDVLCWSGVSSIWLFRVLTYYSKLLRFFFGTSA